MGKRKDAAIFLGAMIIMIIFFSPYFSKGVKLLKTWADVQTLKNINKAETIYYLENNKHSFDINYYNNPNSFESSIKNMKDYITNVKFHELKNLTWININGVWRAVFLDENIPFFKSEIRGLNIGTWDKTKKYNKNDIVIYNDKYFISRKNLNISRLPGIGKSSWQQMTKEWRWFNIYLKGDVVSFDGEAYIAIKNNKGIEITNNQYWVAKYIQ